MTIDEAIIKQQEYMNSVYFTEDYRNMINQYGEKCKGRRTGKTSMKALKVLKELENNTKVYVRMNNRHAFKMVFIPTVLEVIKRFDLPVNPNIIHRIEYLECSVIEDLF